MVELTENELQAYARQCGLELYAHTDMAPLREDTARLAAWQACGYAGEMRFMERAPDLFADPRQLLPNAQTVLVFGVPYGATPHPPRPLGFGRVARYAWGQDYHVVLRERLHRLGTSLSQDLGEEVFFRSFTDAVPLLERAFAARAGLGFIGKNTLLIVAGVGSFLFLGEIVSNLTVRPGALRLVKGECGSCFRCGSDCPTGAIREPRVLDARRCISYLTIEKRTALNPTERRDLGEWLFGCDICQDVCPFNHRAQKEGDPPAFEEFGPQNGVGPLVDLKQLFELPSEAAFRRRFGHTAVSRARRKTLVRNGVVVAANTAAVELTEVVARLASADPSPLVRQHALWAVWVLERQYGAGRVDVTALLNRAGRDSAAEVRQEAHDIGEGIV